MKSRKQIKYSNFKQNKICMINNRTHIEAKKKKTWGRHCRPASGWWHSLYLIWEWKATHPKLPIVFLEILDYLVPKLIWKCNGPTITNYPRKMGQSYIFRFFKFSALLESHSKREVWCWQGEQKGFKSPSRRAHIYFSGFPHIRCSLGPWRCYEQIFDSS